MKLTVKDLLKRLILEIPGFFLLITLAEYILFDSLRAWVIPTEFGYPHPYWIGILLFSIVYGLREGLVASIAAAALYMAFSPFEYNWNPFEWSSTAVFPMLFILVGVLVGLSSTSYKESLGSLIRKNVKLKEQLEEADALATRLNRQNLDLERKIVFRLETFQSVYDIAEKLNRLNLEQLYDVIPQLVGKYVKAEQCSFFLVETDGSLKLKSTFGWSDPPVYPVAYSSDSKLLQRFNTFDETKVLAMEAVKELGLEGFFISALISPERKLLGMIKLESIKFLDVSPDNVRFLSMLSKWITQSILNGLRYAEQEKQSAFEPGTGLVREETFWFLVKRNVASAVRHKHDSTLMLLRLNFPEEVLPVEKNILIAHIGKIIRDICRIDDEVGIADLDRSYSFMFLLPYTTTEKACHVKSKTTEVLTRQLGEKHPYAGDPSFYSWEVLSLEDGSLFLSEVVQNRIFDPLSTG